MKKQLQIQIDDDMEMAKKSKPSPLASLRSRQLQMAQKSPYPISKQTPRANPFREIKTLVKQDNDNEIYVTDAPDVDFDALNEQQIQYEIQSLLASDNQGGVIVTENVTAQNAYQFFKKQESMGYDLASSRILGADDDYLVSTKIELPQVKLQRLKDELDMIEQELKLLEKEEIHIKFDEISEAKTQLNEIEYLKLQMRSIVESSAFKELDSKTQFDEILEQSSQDIVSEAVNKVIAQNLVLNESQVASKVTLGNEIELEVGISKQTDIQKEQLRKYQMLDQQLDQFEKVVGQWNPINKFMNIFQAIEMLSDKVDMLDQKSIEAIGGKAKELNKDLESLVSKLQGMKDIDYDKNKIDYLFMMTEKSLEQEQNIQVIIERLQALEKIHKESPNISVTFQSVKDAQPQIQKQLDEQTEFLGKMKEMLVSGIKEVQGQIALISKQ